ncbi:zinc finger protein [Theobroma cacao]|nr:zinc finger protein [Theobroma cacao]
MGGPSRQCQVCNQAQSKYKCPSCLVPYCSLACFKRHKETPCTKPKSTEEKSGTPCVKSESANDAETTSVKLDSSNDAGTPSLKPESTKERSSENSVPQLHAFMTGQLYPKFLSYQLTDSQNLSLGPRLSASSSEVREALKDEHLQKLISDIDSSPDAMNELDKAMGVDVFRIFSDKILSAINP